MKRVLVTGATGFVGRVLVEDLVRRGIIPTLAVRRQTDQGVPHAIVGEIDGATDWSGVLDGVDTVFHLAGRAHTFAKGAHEESEFFRVNTNGTRVLAEACAQAGVRRLVFLSSVKVLGENSGTMPYDEERETAPEDAYGLSKLEAENAIREIANGKTLGYSIIRTPLVYGPGVKANFLRLIRAVDRGVPLPFGVVRNARSLIYVRNLTDALIRVAEFPAAEGKTYLVSDGRDVSTSDLVRQIAKSLGRRPRLLPFPPSLMRFAGVVMGKSATVRRLLGSLAVDISRIRQDLQWVPPYSADSGLRETAEWYRRTNKDE